MAMYSPRAKSRAAKSPHPSFPFGKVTLRTWNLGSMPSGKVAQIVVDRGVVVVSQRAAISSCTRRRRDDGHGVGVGRSHQQPGWYQFHNITGPSVVCGELWPNCGSPMLKRERHARQVPKREA
eukprot:2203631-Prymnesium_polylepis.2